MTLCCGRENYLRRFPLAQAFFRVVFLGCNFFNLMMDFVLQLLHKCGLECQVGNVFAGALAYADGLILLFPSLVCMQIMLDVCFETLTNVGLQFNIDKCIAVVFGKFIGKSSCKNLVPHNNVLLQSADLHYLGIQFKSGLNIGINNK